MLDPIGNLIEHHFCLFASHILAKLMEPEHIEFLSYESHSRVLRIGDIDGRLGVEYHNIVEYSLM